MGFVLRLNSLLSRTIPFVVLMDIHSSSGKLKKIKQGNEIEVSLLFLWAEENVSELLLQNEGPKKKPADGKSI